VIIHCQIWTQQLWNYDYNNEWQLWCRCVHSFRCFRPSSISAAFTFTDKEVINCDYVELLSKFTFQFNTLCLPFRTLLHFLLHNSTNQIFTLFSDIMFQIIHRLFHVNYTAVQTHVHSPPSSIEFKNAWSSTSTPQYAFMAWCLFKHWVNFTLLLCLYPCNKYSNIQAEHLSEYLSN